MLRRACTWILIATIISAPLAVTTAPSCGEDAEKKFTPRLPPYFAAIVTPSQRREIYALQERFAKETAELKAKLAELQSQLSDLNRQRDDEIEAVLNYQQRKQLQAAREAAAAKRKQR